MSCFGRQAGWIEELRILDVLLRAHSDGTVAPLSNSPQPPPSSTPTLIHLPLKPLHQRAPPRVELGLHAHPRHVLASGIAAASSLLRFRTVNVQQVKPRQCVILSTFYRAQAVLDGRVVVAGPRQRNHPDFPLRGFVRCEICDRPLTGSWSKGRNGRYAYYHCQRQCRPVNVSKAVLEGAFADELALLQPTPGYMRLVKNRVLCVWEQRRAEAKDRTTEQQRRVSAIRQKLNKLNEASLSSEAIDVTTYGRQRDKLREELTFA